MCCMPATYKPVVSLLWHQDGVDTVLSTVWDVRIHKTHIPKSRTLKSRGQKTFIQRIKHNRESVNCFKNNNKRECWESMEWYCQREMVTLTAEWCWDVLMQDQHLSIVGKTGQIWKWTEGIKSTAGGTSQSRSYSTKGEHIGLFRQLMWTDRNPRRILENDYSQGKEGSDSKIVLKAWWESCYRPYFALYFKGYGTQKEC